MPFKAIVDSLDDLEEMQREYYKESKIRGADGKERSIFALDLESVDQHPTVAALKNAHERQKAETAKAKARIAELEAQHVNVPDGFSAEEWDRLKAVDEEVKKGSNPDNKKLHDAEVQSVKAMYEQKLANLVKTNDVALKAKDEIIAQRTSALRSRVVGDDLTKALVEAGVDKKYLAATRALLEKSVKVIEENGSMSAVFETDLGEQPIDTFIPQWAQSDVGKHFMVPATGGGAHGSDGKGQPHIANNPFGKASWNFTEQAQLYKQDAGKADRMAKVAGHAAAIGARRENAK